MSVILSCVYATGVKWLRWKLTMFLCRSIHDELRPGDIIPDRPCVNWDYMPVTLYKECCLGAHFTKFVAYMMWLDKFGEGEARRYYVIKEPRPPTRDINGYPLQGEDVCP